MVNIILHGCGGKMGKMIAELCKDQDQVAVVAGIDPGNCDGLDFPVYQSIKECQKEADVVIDFSTAPAVPQLIQDCVEKKLPLVLCTTGISEEGMSQVQAASMEIPILRSANMSLGINVLMQALQDIAKKLDHKGFDIEIVEKHHNQKIDAPSGTALALANAMEEALEDSYEYVYDRSNLHQARKSNEIGISAVRGGSIPGEHDIIFAGLDEVITIRHTAYSRRIFAKGAVEAAKFLKGKAPGFYQMQHVIESAE
ncbi:MAG: 4-hydroxy-tetrahydrodipicolinate reductase [Lachnospiraceae bacterium]|nr:4-hydroxy-tetrahydrodipicolinate reductase [Lachnospiraceae bacterium]